jgi:hypothetical protein
VAAASGLAAAAALALAHGPAATPPGPVPATGARAGGTKAALPGADVAPAALSADAETASLAADLAALGDDDFDPLPEADTGLGGLTSDELLVMDRLLAGTGG